MSSKKSRPAAEAGFPYHLRPSRAKRNRPRGLRNRREIFSPAESTRRRISPDVGKNFSRGECVRGAPRMSSECQKSIGNRPLGASIQITPPRRTTRRISVKYLRRCSAWSRSGSTEYRGVRNSRTPTCSRTPDEMTASKKPSEKGRASAFASARRLFSRHRRHCHFRSAEESTPQVSKPRSVDMSTATPFPQPQSSTRVWLPRNRRAISGA